MPYPVAGGEAVVADDYIYILGGYSDSTQSNVNWIQRYNPETGEWDIAGRMLYPRFGFGAGVYDGNIALFGGLEDTTEIVNTLEIWDPLDSAQDVSVFSNPAFNRIFPAAIIDGDKFYIFGGNPNPSAAENRSYFSFFNFSDSSLISDSIASQFEGEFPEQQMAVKVGDKIHLFGGVFFGVSQSAYQFDLMTNKLRESKSQLQTPRANGKAVYANEDIFLIGGYNESSAALNEVERINLSDSTFTAFNVAPLNYPRRNLMAVNYKGRIFVFGGFDRDGNVVSEIEYYLPDNTTSAEEELETSKFSDVKIYQNYPNPFNPETVIRFEVQSNGSHYEKDVNLKIYDVLGNEITTLVDEEKAPGVYEVKFNASNYSSGVYFYQLKSEYKTFTKKMILTK